MTVDCDVLQADGGTRTASVTGAYRALRRDRLDSRKIPRRPPLIVNSVAAISVGIIDGSVLVDLDYCEDVRAEVDFNVVMTGERRIHRGARDGRRTPV